MYPTTTDRIGAIVMFGDPMHQGTLGIGKFPSKISNKRIKTYCNRTDAVCLGTPFILAGHLTYATEVDDAAKWINGVLTSQPLDAPAAKVEEESVEEESEEITKESAEEGSEEEVAEESTDEDAEAADETAEVADESAEVADESADAADESSEDASEVIINGSEEVAEDSADSAEDAAEEGTAHSHDE
jgi:Cutinase